MKRYLFFSISVIVIFCFMFSLTVSAEETKVVVYALDDYPPYSYVKNGTVQGIYTEILKQAFLRMNGYRITIKPVPWKRGLKYLERGSGFALYPPYHRTKERPYIWPYSLFLADEKVVVFCTEGVFAKSPRPNWPDDYYGLTVGNNAGYEFGGEKFWEAVKKGKISIDEAKTTRQNVQKLAKKRTDCYMSDRLSFLWELKLLKEQKKYEEGNDARLVEGPTISSEQGFLGFTDRDNGNFDYKKDFIKQFDTIIYDMRKHGELQKIIDECVK
ncbi:MAG: amino acid ABC transporter substrate-binding protein [Desulfobacterales bacterium]|nr:amino acid ABC transporter substrate-binding protein [Desulfobacterales bacterium]